MDAKAYNAEGKIVGHLPMELSRITKFLMDRGATLTATLKTTYYRISPLMQGGLELPCSVDVYMKSSTISSKKLIQRYTELVENLYMEPLDDICVGSFVKGELTARNNFSLNCSLSIYTNQTALTNIFFNV